MTLPKTLASAFLALGFGVVSYGMLRIEPQMGFVTVADFFDPVKVAAGYGSPLWLVENFIYVGFSIALLVLATSSHDARSGRAGVVAAVLVLLIAALDRVGIQLPSLLPTPRDVVAAVGATIPIRGALLKTMVVALGIFAWSTTRSHGDPGIWLRTWRGLGWVVLAVSIVFFFVYLPAPVVFCVWAIGLTIRTTTGGDPQARARGSMAGG